VTRSTQISGANLKCMPQNFTHSWTVQNWQSRRIVFVLITMMMHEMSECPWKKPTVVKETASDQFSFSFKTTLCVQSKQDLSKCFLSSPFSYLLWFPRFYLQYYFVLHNTDLPQWQGLSKYPGTCSEVSSV
jgi:hypothetical protein